MKLSMVGASALLLIAMIVGTVVIRSVWTRGATEAWLVAFMVTFIVRLLEKR